MVDIKYVAKWYGFYDFKEKLELNNEEYESLITTLYYDGKIAIKELDNDYSKSMIKATKEAVTYLLEHNIIKQTDIPAEHNRTEQGQK